MFSDQSTCYGMDSRVTNKFTNTIKTRFLHVPSSFPHPHFKTFFNMYNVCIFDLCFPMYWSAHTYLASYQIWYASCERCDEV
jgi:hypothetical protein